MHAKTLFAASLAAAVVASSGAHARPMLLVSAEAGGEIVVVDPAKAAVVQRIKVGARPRGLKLSRDRRRLLVALGGPPKSAAAHPGTAPAPAGSGGLAVVDVATWKVTKHVATAPGPFGVDLLPDGRTAFLSNTDTNELFAIDVDAGAVKNKALVGMEPEGVAVRPDGKVVYVATHAAHEISALDAQTMKLLGRIDGGLRPQTVLFAQRGAIAYVIDEGVPSITILDAKRNEFKEQFVLTGLPKAPAAPVLQSAVLSPDGKFLYVTTGPGWSVLFVDLAKKAAVATIASVGAFPRGIAISPDGKKLYVANAGSNDVAIVDVASKKVDARVPVPGTPFGIVLLP